MRQSLLISIPEIALGKTLSVTMWELQPETVTTRFAAAAEDRRQDLPNWKAHAICKANS